LRIIGCLNGFAILTQQKTDKVLKEGNSYCFRVLHEIEMPPDNEGWYVLESEYGSRHLILKEYYSHYELFPGKEIICRVDKVNCSGKIFLEPINPFIKNGESLLFDIVSSLEHINSFGEKEKLLSLTDPWGKQAFLNVDQQFGIDGNKILCRIERVKKGNLLISDPARKYFGEGRIPDAGQPFKIDGIISLSPNLEYYILSQGNSLHYLRVKYFTNYGFHKGDLIEARVLGPAGLYQHYLEPLHPFYTPGETYLFDYVRTEELPEVKEHHTYNLIVKDLLGHEYALQRSGNEPPWIKKVVARVSEIRMSKCQLEFIDIE
jgi:hypothetical protein